MSTIANLDNVASPALLFDLDGIKKNLQLMIDIVGGDPARLRPHIKTHKCRDILELQLTLGINRVKCATIAEAEISALAGVPDVLISYPLVGPNVARFFKLIETYPQTRFSTLVDDEDSLQAFIREGGAPVDLFVDLDCGMHRTGVAPGAPALSLAQAIIAEPSLRFAGLHAYDGHIHDGPIEDRTKQFEMAMKIVDETIAQFEEAGITIPLVVSGGSPTFGLHAARAAKDRIPRECSPGTTVLWDFGYGDRYPEDLPFERAALLLTRVISHPGKGLACLDLGHKGVAAENILSQRVMFPAFPEAEFVSQSEEHLVISLPEEKIPAIGTALIGIPKHVCPTVALHQEAQLVEQGAITGEAWAIGARDRRLSI